MSNEDQQIQSTEFESETNIEEPPSLEETLEVLDKVFEDNNDGIDAEKLLADAEIDLSTFALCVESHMEHEQKSYKSTFMFGASLEALIEAELDVLSDEEVLSYLQAEGIDCEQFISRAIHLIKNSLVI